MHYHANIVKKGASYLVSFPEFENIHTYGQTLEEAVKNAGEALNGALESDFERGFSFPEPKPHLARHFHPIPVLPHLEIAITLRKLRQGRSQSEIARTLGITYQAYQKLENPRKCNPRIKTLERICKLLGHRIEVAFM